MKALRKLTALLLAAALMLSLAACGGRSMKDSELLQIGEEVFTRQEAEIFALSQHNLYTAQYGEEIWEVALSEGSFEEYVKKALLDYLERLFLTDCAAKAAGIALSVSEKAAVEKAADALFNGLSEETREKTGITRELCGQAYARYAMAQIYFRKVLGRSMAEVSDEEARAMQLQIVSVSKNAGIGKAQEILEKIKEGTLPAEAIRETEGAAIRTETVVRGIYPEKFDTLVFALKKDQWSPVITLDNEYVMVRCALAYDAEATALHKAEMEKQKREDQLQEALETYAKDITMVMNPRVWDDLSLRAYAGLSAANFYDYTDPLNADY